MTLVIRGDGSCRALYDEAIDLAALGRLVITRAGVVEPDDRGLWHADLGLAGGPVLGPFALRSAALAAEVARLEAHRLGEPR